jgi:anaerobic ribonucleoside-triphosphate reductase activating protein
MKSAGIRINKLHFPVTSLGYGKRVGIWTQGCSIRCPGCISRDTWDFAKEKCVAVAHLVDFIEPWLAQADGVTISGGEPFDQPEALAELVCELALRAPGDVLVYSGYAKGLLLQKHAQILAGIDVLISEPYQPDAGTSLALRGSDNQQVTLLSEAARQRYPADLDRRPWEPTRKLDLSVDGDTVWMTGIPRPGEIAELKRRLASAGLACRSSDEPLVCLRA